MWILYRYLGLAWHKLSTILAIWVTCDSIGVWWKKTPFWLVTGVDVAAAAGAAMVAASGVVVVAWLHFLVLFFSWKTVEPASITILEMIYRTLYNFLIWCNDLFIGFQPAVISEKQLPSDASTKSPAHRGDEPKSQRPDTEGTNHVENLGSNESKWGMNCEKTI